MLAHFGILPALAIKAGSIGTGDPSHRSKEQPISLATAIGSAL